MKTVVITGVGNGVGYYLAKEFIKNGYNVVGSYNTSVGGAKELNKIGVKTFKCNVANAKQVESFFDYV